MQNDDIWKLQKFILTYDFEYDTMGAGYIL